MEEKERKDEQQQTDSITAKDRYTIGRPKGSDWEPAILRFISMAIKNWHQLNGT